jgi:uncharacterized alpha-E superfamily protein
MDRAVAGQLSLTARPGRDSARVGRQGPAQRQARSIRTRLQNSRMEEIFQSGLHEFISTFVADNNRLGSAISQQYLA